MKTLLSAALAALFLSGAAQATTPANADASQEAALKKLVEQRLGEGVKVESIRKTPYGGLYEVRVGNDIVYTDAKADYIFVGRILDAKTQQDYTRARIDEINKIKFADLPLDSAIKMVKGNGKRVIAVFEDPNCGYCKRFRQTLAEMDNITVYTFLYNILSEDSAEKSKNIWCSPDKAKAWDEWMLRAKAAPAAPASCNTPNEKVLELGRKYKITGTPTIFFTDGTRIPGAIDRNGLESKLGSVK
ncbi:Thiol:disulfide interchange protein DsbC [Noviherbaspirillum humi]|uniref:Thiol:disulfide interchange protein n=1 Tax=Noviherbaspirillum humi TaxID=1688639 RepID=A0A239LQ89_9BURK|nr:DsbC family protein [Noviherbaspirillum humi]SNT32535.1 Thiol:disulfide interchange protein DsbC [Noviherbaspirillum humi]